MPFLTHTINKTSRIQIKQKIKGAKMNENEKYPTMIIVHGNSSVAKGKKVRIL